MQRLRTYITGLGSSGALLAAAIVAFLAVGALVAIDGMPGSSADATDRSILVDTDAPEAAAAAAILGAAPPAARPDRAAAEAAAGPGGSGPGGAAGSFSGSGSEGNAGSGSGDGTGIVPGDSGAGPAPGPAPGAGPSPAPGGGPASTGDLVGEVDRAVGGATGLDLGLGEKTKPITDSVDKAVEGLTGGRLPGGVPQLPGLPRSLELGG
jgi:hypothetical protein